MGGATTCSFFYYHFAEFLLYKENLVLSEISHGLSIAFDT